MLDVCVLHVGCVHFLRVIGCIIFSFALCLLNVMVSEKGEGSLCFVLDAWYAMIIFLHGFNVFFCDHDQAFWKQYAWGSTTKQLKHINNWELYWSIVWLGGAEVLAKKKSLYIIPVALRKALTLYFIALTVILAFCCLLEDDWASALDFFPFCPLMKLHKEMMSPLNISLPNPLHPRLSQTDSNASRSYTEAHRIREVRGWQCSHISIIKLTVPQWYSSVRLLVLVKSPCHLVIGKCGNKKVSLHVRGSE